jgi:hypothetical protein
MKKELTIYIQNMEDFLEGNHGWCFHLSSYDDLEGEGYVKFKTLEVDLSFDRAEFTKLALEQLENETKKVRTDMESRLSGIESRKQKLMSITHEVGS